MVKGLNVTEGSGGGGFYRARTTDRRIEREISSAPFVQWDASCRGADGQNSPSVGSSSPPSVVNN